jgi:serine/threonine-protein kinase
MNVQAEATQSAPPELIRSVPRDPGAPEPTRLAFPGRFQIIKRLGAGGMAEVFAAHRMESDGSRTPVVIKRPLPELAAHPEFLDMFLDEARIACAIKHPNVVQVHELVRDGEDCLLVMELVDGKPLSSLMARSERRRQRLEARVAAHLVARAAEGLHHAHCLTDQAGNPLGIVHRDVSPQNVLVSFDGEVKVIDFGIARAANRVTRTKTGTRKGKTGYMAPEQAKSGAIDRRVDVFALGILMWELLCGRRLFVRPDEYRTMNALLIDPILPPSRYAAVSPELEEIVMRALDRDPAQRFDTAEQLRAALDAYVTSLGRLSRGELSRAIRAVFPEESSILPREEEPSAGAEIAPQVLSRATIPVETRRLPRRQLALLAGGAVAAAALGGVLGWVGKRLRAGTPPAIVASAAPPSGAPVPRTIGVEPLAPRSLAPDQVAVAVPPTRPADPPIAAGPAPELPAAPPTADPAVRPERPRRATVARRRPSDVDGPLLPPKKNPF